MANEEHVRRVLRASKGDGPPGDLREADLSDAILTSAKLAGVSLRGANLNKANLGGAYLRGADLSDANLTRAKMSLADLREAKLENAALKNADLTGSVLRSAELRGADLTSCMLTRADLTAANLAGARMTKADLRGAVGLTPDQVRAAKDWQKSMYDFKTAQMLGVVADPEIARRGVRKPRAKRGGFAIDLLAGRPLVFGDLLQLTGVEASDFPPSEGRPLAGLENLGFEPADDYLAVRQGQDELIWLIELPAHRPKTLEGVRLELASRKARSVERFLHVLRSLTDALRAKLRHVDADGKPAEMTDLDAVARELLPRAKP